MHPFVYTIAMDTTTIKKLAELARLKIQETEEATTLADLSSILNYIDQISEVKVGEVEGALGVVRNVARLDQDTTQTGEYSEDLLAAAPDTKDGFVKVQKIL